MHGHALDFGKKNKVKIDMYRYTTSDFTGLETANRYGEKYCLVNDINHELHFAESNWAWVYISCKPSLGLLVKYKFRIKEARKYIQSLSGDITCLTEEGIKNCPEQK